MRNRLLLYVFSMCMLQQAFHMLDALTTLLCIRMMAGQEANPLMLSIYTDPLGVLIKSSILMFLPWIGMLYIAYKYHYRKDVYWMLVIGSSLLAFLALYPVVNNVLLLTGYGGLPLAPFIPTIWNISKKILGWLFT